MTKLISNPINLAAPAFKDLTTRAKAGDREAARQLLSKVITAERLDTIRASLGNTSNIVFVPIAGDNPLPTRTAEFLQFHLRGEIALDTIQIVEKPWKRKDQSLWDKLTTHRDFSVENTEHLKDKRVVLVDDQFTTGGTVRDAKLLLEKEGVKVDSVFSLGQGRWKTIQNVRSLEPTPELTDKFNRLYSSSDQKGIRKVLGTEPQHLTHIEMFHLTSKTNVPKIRRAIARTQQQTLFSDTHEPTLKIQEQTTQYETAFKPLDQVLSQNETSQPTKRWKSLDEMTNQPHSKSVPERVAIVGSREYPDLDKVKEYVNGLPEGTTVVSGHARGVDQTAEQAAKAKGLTVTSIPADWEKHGKQAGPLRNTDIVNQADRVVAFWDGRSSGTKDTIDKATRANKPVKIVRPGITKLLSR